MNKKNSNRSETTILNTTITVGLVAMFLAFAALLMSGAILRQRTADQRHDLHYHETTKDDV